MCFCLHFACWFYTEKKDRIAIVQEGEDSRDKLTFCSFENKGDAHIGKWHLGGEVVQALKRTGAYENTLIVFASDNDGRWTPGANNGPVQSGKGSTGFVQFLKHSL